MLPVGVRLRFNHRVLTVETTQQSLAEATGGALDLAGLGVQLTEVLRFDRSTFDALDAEILSVFDRSAIVTPDDVRGDAFIRTDDPIAEGERIRSAVAAGYLVRTRTDVPGIDAPAGDSTRRGAAFVSGAQYLSTDYYVADDALGYTLVVDLPGDDAARCNPVNAPVGCEL